MATYDEEIRVAIIVTADGVQAGTDQAAVAIEDFNTRITAAQSQAAAAYTASQQAWVDAQARVSQVLADMQSASVAQITGAYEALNAARDANLANAQAYLAELSTAQRSALGVEDYAAQGAAQSLAEQVIAERAAAEAAYEASAAQLEEAGALDAATAAADAETAAELENAGAKVVNRGATIGLAEAVGGLARGNVGMAAYGMARMGIASRMMAALMTPAGLTVAGLTAALVGFGVAAVEGALQSQRLADALLVTSDASGQTLGQLQAMAGQLATGDTTIGDARDAILALAQSGRFTGDSFRQAAAAVVDFASLTGQNTQQASKYVEQLATATTQQLIKANEQYHFLTLAQFTQIENLRKEGKQAEATEAIMDAFYGAMHARAQTAIADEGYIARGWDDVKRAVSAAVSELESWGRVQAPTQQIASLEQQLKAVQARDPNNVTGVATRLEAEIAQLRQVEAQHQANARAASASTAATDNAIAARYGTGVAHGAHAAAAYTPLAHAESASSAHQTIAEDARILAALQRDAERRVQIAAQVNSINENAARRHAQAMLQVHLDQLRTEEAQGKISHAQELADEQKLYAEEYARQLAAYQQELQLEKNKPAVVARINAEIEALQDAHAQRMAKSAEVAAQKQAKAFQSALAPISSAFSTAVNGIIQGTQTMQMAVSRILDSVLLKYLDVILQGRVEWVASELQKTAATVAQSLLRTQVVQNSHLLREGITKAEVALHIGTEASKTGETTAAEAARTAAHASAEATRQALTLAARAAGRAAEIAANVATIQGDAAKAGAGAFAAIVGIPYVGPALAPAAAAEAVASVEAFVPMASLAVGAWDLPRDMVAQLHAHEMVVPRTFAEGIRQGGGSGASSTVENHWHIHGAADAQSFHEMLQRNPEALAAGMRHAMRSGAFA